MITADIKTATPKLSATIGGGATGKGNVTSVNKKIGDVVLTASDIHFLDGQNFQEKYNSGELRGQKGDKGENGTIGKDGVSPTAEVTQGTGEAVITITDGKGTTTATLKDGTSPTASIKQDTDGATVTITDASGTTTAKLLNGKDGKGDVSSVNGKTGEVILTTEDFVLTGLNKSLNTEISENDTELSAFGKLQGQINTIISYPPVRATLNDYSWAEIAQIALLGANDESAFARYNLHVGDVKGVEINGTVSGVKFAGKYYCNIIGFNHNWEIEGKGISFGFGKSALTGGKDIAFMSFKMNDTDTNVGGWKGSKMYKETCTQFFNALSPDLQAVITPTIKYTDNIGGGKDVPENVTTTSNLISIPAEFEVHGSRSYANSHEQNYQLQYDYYKAENSKVKHNHSNTNSTVIWWVRSPRYGYATRFCRVSTDGNPDNGDTGYSYGFAPIFRVMGGTGKIGSMQNKLIDNERRIAELEKKLQTALLSMGGNV